MLKLEKIAKYIMEIYSKYMARDVSPMSNPNQSTFYGSDKDQDSEDESNSCTSNLQAPQTKLGDALFVHTACEDCCVAPLLSRNLFTKGERFGEVLEIVKHVV
ncbi:hypothetical protein V1520DRAFT_111508 [Lipomyces starkeyi]